MTTKGIDVSEWNGNIDWRKVKEAGIDFAIIRAGFGRVNTQKDKCFEQNYKNAKAAGLKVGAYHYSYAISVDEAKIEANVCLEWLKSKAFELPIYFDMEESSIAKLGKKMCTAIAKAFCDVIKAKGYKAGIYSNLNWFTNYLDYEDLKKNYSIWFAQWHNTHELACDIWQNSDSGTVSGIKGKVDTNICYTDFNMAQNNTNKSDAATTYYLQIGAYTDKATADKMADKAKTEGFKNVSVIAKTAAPIKNTTVSNKIAVGDKVKLSANAVIYGTNSKFADFVYKSTLYVREIKGQRVVISTLKAGAVTGAVDVKYLTKI